MWYVRDLRDLHAVLHHPLLCPCLDSERNHHFRSQVLTLLGHSTYVPLAWLQPTKYGFASSLSASPEQFTLILWLTCLLRHSWDASSALQWGGGCHASLYLITRKHSRLPQGSSVFKDNAVQEHLSSNLEKAPWWSDVIERTVKSTSAAWGRWWDRPNSHLMNCTLQSA